MTEVWFKYGKTEIFTDIEGPLEILQPYKKWSDKEKLIELIGRTLGNKVKTLVIDYVYSVEGYDDVVYSTVEALIRNGVDENNLKVFVTCWRYSEPALEKTAATHIKDILKGLLVTKIENLQRIDMLDLDKALFITPTIYWDGEITGVAHFLRMLGLGLEVKALTPVVGYGGSVAEVAVGESEEVAKPSMEKAEKISRYIPTNTADIILLGGPGHPVDSSFSTSMNISASVLDIRPGKVIVFILECSEGLGKNAAVFLLNNKNIGSEVDGMLKKRYEIWRKIVTEHKICMVTALPSTIVSNLLNARQMDTLEQALAYGWRVKSKDSTVLAIPNSLGTRLVGF